MIPVTAADARLVIERLLPADRATAFRCWTDPAHLARWFLPTAAHAVQIAEIDLRVGGRYRLGLRKAGEDKTHTVTGVYREISPPEKLVFTWAWETNVQPPDKTLVTVEFHADGDRTRLVLTHERFPHAKTRDQHVEGWSGCLEQLARLLGAQTSSLQTN